MVVSICDNDIVLGVDGYAAGLCELALQDPELTELAVVDHLLPLDLYTSNQSVTASISNLCTLYIDFFPRPKLYLRLHFSPT